MHYSCQGKYIMQNIKTNRSNIKKKKKKPIDTGKQSYDEYGDKKNQKIDYERDRPPHW
jgi:hypothetical protein